MSWDLRKRHQARPDERSAHLIATWDAWDAITDVSLEKGPGVSRTSFGGSSRREMSAGMKVEGVFRWSEETTTPVAVLAWTDGGGERHELNVSLERD